MADIVARNSRSTRLRKAPKNYTPSKTPTGRPVNYEINLMKTMKKKISGTERANDSDLELKQGNIVLTFSTAAYEAFKAASFLFYDNHADLDYKVTRKTSKNQQANLTLTVEESLSIRSKGSSRQLYRKNFFNTTSRVDINGKYHVRYLEKDLPEIMKKIQGYDFKSLNEKIAVACKTLLNKDKEIDNVIYNDHSNMLPDTDHSTVSIRHEKNKTEQEQEKVGTKTPDVPTRKPLHAINKLIIPDISPVSSNDQQDLLSTRSAETEELVYVLCSTCDKIIEELEYINCTLCNSSYHNACVDPLWRRYSDLDKEKLFICTSCKQLDKVLHTLKS